MATNFCTAHTYDRIKEPEARSTFNWCSRCHDWFWPNPPKDHKCDDCGRGGASLYASGYIRPLYDVAPSYSEWEEIWLCGECTEWRQRARTNFD